MTFSPTPGSKPAEHFPACTGLNTLKSSPVRPSAGPSRTRTRSLDLVSGKQRRLFGCCVSEPRRWTALCSCIIFTVMLTLSLWLQCACSLPVRSDRQLGNVAGRAVTSGGTLLTAPTETVSESGNSAQETRLLLLLLVFFSLIKGRPVGGQQPTAATGFGMNFAPKTGDKLMFTGASPNIECR